MGAGHTRNTMDRGSVARWRPFLPVYRSAAGTIMGGERGGSYPQIVTM